MALRRIAIPSPNYSTRGGANVRLIVLHTAEGARTIQSLGAFFQNRSNQVSSHVGIDDTPNTVAVYVPRAGKAWTSANANPVAVQAELCAFARWTPAEWKQHPEMLKNTAAWVAEEAKAFGIPIVKLTPGQAQAGGRGVCQHVDLGSWGGGHHDCGTSFPIDQVLSMAKGQAPTSPGPPKPPAPKPPAAYPAWPGRLLRRGVKGKDVVTWQTRMKNRGWTLTIDGNYGPASESVCKQFQKEKKLRVDGIVGKETWDAAWRLPVS